MTPSSTTSTPPTASEMLDSVRTEAVELRSFTITFLSLLVYLSLIVVATDHEQILRVAPVTLPLLDVKIPILGFYKFMPPFLFFMHLYILVQHYLFSQLAFKFEDALRLESPDMQDNIRRRLGNLPFMHWLLGRRGTFIQFIMVFISLISLVIWPLIMFWWMQASFLPYHDEGLVFGQQFWLSIDVLMLAYLWAKILDKTDSVLHWWWQLMELGSGFRRLCRYEWRYTHLHWRRWRSAISSRPIGVWLGLWLQIGRPIMLNPQHRLRIKVALGNMWTGFIRSVMALLLLTALGFSWLVSITPDSGQEKRWLKALLWFESQIDQDPSTYWLLTDVNDRKLEVFLEKPKPRFLFKPTAWLHEKKYITVTVKPKLTDNGSARLTEDNSDQQDLRDYDPARVTKIDCNHDNNKTGQKPSLDKEGGKPDKVETLKDSAEKIQCYLVDSWLPRNMILRERLLTANAEVKPELAAALAADQKQVAASKLNEISPLDLKGRNFDYADFSESSLPRVDLRRASLKHADLSNARLEKAQLRLALLDDAILGFAKLAGANLSKAELTGAVLTRAELAGANLTGAELAGANLTEAELAGANLTGANNLIGADLTGAELAGANLAGAELAGANLLVAKLTGANLSGAKLAGADLAMAELTGADLRKAELAGAYLTGAELAGADLREAKLDGVDLRWVKLAAGADLTGAELAGALLPDSNLPLTNAQEINELVYMYRQHLEKVPDYQTFDGKNTIAEKAAKLRESVGKAADFTNIKLFGDFSDYKLNMVSCLANDPQLAEKIGCVIWDQANQQQRDHVLSFWTALACQASSHGNIAEFITDRALESGYQVDYEWQDLALKLDKAAQDTKACPGLSSLTKDMRERLNTAALNQANAQKTP